MIQLLFFYRQATEHVQRECHYSSLLLIRAIDSVTTDPCYNWPNSTPPHKLAKYKLWVRYTTHQGTQCKRKMSQPQNVLARCLKLPFSFVKHHVAHYASCDWEHILKALCCQKAQRREKSSVTKIMYASTRACMQY